MQAEVYHHGKHRKVSATLQQMYSLANMLIEDACLQVNWGAKLLFVASFIFFAKAVSKWLANADSTKEVMPHCFTLMLIYSGHVITCLLPDY